jgi:hypothetical protein
MRMPKRPRNPAADCGGWMPGILSRRESELMNRNPTPRESMKSQVSPIIVIGAHRSGTSMVTRMLETMGLFVGKEKDDNHEAKLFNRINLWLIAQCGGSWEHPQAVQYLLENEEIRRRTIDYIARYLLQSPRAISYLGWNLYLRHGTPARLRIPWGWKCPLNTYTLPLWLDMFPEAKVIHIYRHGVDVANSLRARMRRDMRQTRMQQIYYRLRFLHWIKPKKGGFTDAFRCASLEGGLSLWEEYLSEARRHVSNLNGRAMELKYEDFLAEPVPALKQLASFCNLPLSDPVLEQAARHVKKERAYAYLGNAELRTFASRVTERLGAYSYY